MTGRIVWWVLIFCWDIQMVASEFKHGSILPLQWWCNVCVCVGGFLAVDFKSAAPLRCCYGTIDQSLWGMCQGRCCVFVAKNEGRSEGKRGSTTSKVYLIKLLGECILHMFWTKPVTYIPVVFFFFFLILDIKLYPLQALVTYCWTLTYCSPHIQFVGFKSPS